MSDKLKIKPLSGEESWSKYKFQISCALKRKDIWEIVTGEELQPDPPAQGAADDVVRVYKANLKTWKIGNNTAMDMFSTSVSDDYLEQIMVLGSAKEIWEYLVNCFEWKTAHRAEGLMAEFWSLSMNPDESVNAYVMRMKEKWARLNEAAVHQQANTVLPDFFLMIRTLTGLPPAYDTFVAIWNGAPEDERTYANLLDRLIVEEQRIQKKRVSCQGRGI